MSGCFNRFKLHSFVVAITVFLLNICPHSACAQDLRLTIADAELAPMPGRGVMLFRSRDAGVTEMQLPAINPYANDDEDIIRSKSTFGQFLLGAKSFWHRGFGVAGKAKRFDYKSGVKLTKSAITPIYWYSDDLRAFDFQSTNYTRPQIYFSLVKRW